jgi:hypothetical protein
VNTASTHHADISLIDSSFAARRLFITLLLMTLGGSSMYVVSVVLPEEKLGLVHLPLDSTVMEERKSLPPK